MEMFLKGVKCGELKEYMHTSKDQELEESSTSTQQKHVKTLTMACKG